MAGLRGQAREPNADARARRNSQNLSSSVDFIDQTGVIFLDGDGLMQLNLASGGGLENSSAELQIKLDTDPGLALSASGLIIDLDTDPGLQLGAGGLSVIAATESNIGGVNQSEARADSGQSAVTLTGVTTTVTDPADTPADADALRDDLVTNALAEIETALGNLSTRDGELETAIETLASEFNDLLSKLRTAGVLAT